mgnify:CR=1 FL=1
MDEMQPMPAEHPDAEQDKFTVCIEVHKDGTFYVGKVDPMAHEAAETPENPEPGMQQAPDVKTALTMALEIIKSGGKDRAADFDAGYEETPLR